MASSTMIRSVQMQNIEPMDPEVIKAFIQGFNDKKAELKGWPVLRLPSSATSNVVVLMAEENSLDRDLIARGAAETTLTIDGNRRRYNAILAIIDLVYYLRKHNEICTLREAYYHIKAFDPENQVFEIFRDVKDCYQAIADVASLLRCPRRALGFVAAPRGLVAGCLSWRSGDSDTWVDGGDGTVREIGSGWLTDSARQLRSDAKCVLVIFSAARKHIRSSTPSRLA